MHTKLLPGRQNHRTRVPGECIRRRVGTTENLIFILRLLDMMAGHSGVLTAKYADSNSNNGTCFFGLVFPLTGKHWIKIDCSFPGNSAVCATGLKMEDMPRGREELTASSSSSPLILRSSEVTTILHEIRTTQMKQFAKWYYVNSVPTRYVLTGLQQTR